MPSYTASAHFSDDGAFVTSVKGLFAFGEEQQEISWEMNKSSDGTLVSVRVSDANGKEVPRLLKYELNGFFTNVLTEALSNKRKEFFHHSTYYYVGPQLDGEYWLKGFRLAPAFPNDPDLYLINAERPVALDYYVNAVDAHMAVAISEARAKRFIARLSLISNIGFYKSGGEQRWVLIPQPEGGFISQRYQLGYAAQNISHFAMPSKGELSRLGDYSSSIKDWGLRAGKLLSLPHETRRILQWIEDAKNNLSEAFDNAARMYQAALVIGGIYPSISLAYKVAAVEALSLGDTRYGSFGTFMEGNLETKDYDKKFIDALYGIARSAHFHSGRFPVDDALDQLYNPFWTEHGLVSADLSWTGHRILRLAMINWLVMLL